MRRRAWTWGVSLPGATRPGGRVVLSLPRMKRQLIIVIAAGLLGCEESSSSACGDACVGPNADLGKGGSPTAPAGPERDAGVPDGGGGADDGEIVDPSLDDAQLPADLVAAAAAPLVDADATAVGAKSFEAESDNVSSATVAPLVEPTPARAMSLVIRWGTIPPALPPAVASWADFSGSLAVSRGSLEIVRPIRWPSAADPAVPLPASEFVAPQTDPRLVRFRSFIGAGSAGLALRVHRPTIRPTVLMLSVNGVTRQIPLEEFMSQSIVAGGWQVEIGNVQFDSSVTDEAAGCYLETGTLAGTWSYASGTTFASLGGSVARPDGGSEALSLSFGEGRGPYGNYTGTLGASGATVAGFYAIHSVFGTYAKEGRFIARVDAGGTVQEYVTGAYDGAAASGRLFRRVPCDTPGASHRNLWRI